MTEEHGLYENITLIENIVQDQIVMIEARLRALERPEDPEEALKKAAATLMELNDSCALVKALLGHLKDNGNTYSIRAG